VKWFTLYIVLQSRFEVGQRIGNPALDDTNMVLSIARASTKKLIRDAANAFLAARKKLKDRTFYNAASADLWYSLCGYRPGLFTRANFTDRPFIQSG
jgi:glycosyltransferase involved in cell wall biosynthesis